MPKIRLRTKEKKSRRMLKIVWFLALLIACSSIITPAPQSSAEETPPMPLRQARSVMYVMDSANLHLRDADAERIDQLNVAFALIRDGEADISHWLGLKKVQSFLKKHPHIDGVLSVGGWGAEGFSDACATEEGRVRLSSSILRVMDEAGFTGVDIDWEYPGVDTGLISRPEDVENWYALLALLRQGLDEREALHGREYLLSVALGAGESHLAAIDPARLAPLLDQAVLMAYDLKGFDRITGHHAGLYPGQGRKNTAAWAVETLVAGGFPADKVLLGMPAYGRVWRQVSGGGNGYEQRANTSGNRVIGFDDVLRLEDEGYTRHWDEIAHAAWWFNGATFVSAEDDRSIQAKCDYVKEQALQGVAVWQYTQDESGAMLSMLDAALR